MTSLTSSKYHTKIGKSKTESVLNFFPPLYIAVYKKTYQKHSFRLKKTVATTKSEFIENKAFSYFAFLE